MVTVRYGGLAKLCFDQTRQQWHQILPSNYSSFAPILVDGCMIQNQDQFRVLTILKQQGRNQYEAAIEVEYHSFGGDAFSSGAAVVPRQGGVK